MGLRRLTEHDADELLRVVSESVSHLKPWLSWVSENYDRDTALGFLAATAHGWERGTLFNHAIVHSGAIVGVAGAEREGDLVEVGYWLHPAHTGRGLVTEAIRETVEFAFGLGGVERVQIWHDEANIPSSGVPRRLGFTRIDRRTPPREPRFGSEVGVDVVWEIRRSGSPA